MRDTRNVATTTGPSKRRSRQKAWRVAGFACLLVLVLSLGFNAYFVHTSVDYFKAATAIRLDPAGFKTYAADRAELQTDRPLLVFFGDSRARMWPEPTIPTGYQVVNRGIGFQTTAQILLRFDADVATLHPKVVVIEAGVNDLKAIAIFPERRAEIVADCEANLERIVDRCRQTGATVVVVTIFDIGDVSLWRRAFWSGQVAVAVREVNAFLPKLAAEKVVLFDANQVLVGERGEIRPEYQFDYLHVSSIGYAALNRKLVPFLSTLPR